VSLLLAVTWLALAQEPAPEAPPASAVPLVEAPPVSAVPLVEALPEPAEGEPSERLPWLGAQLDLGVPAGVGLSAVLRPLPWLRLQGGPAYNTIAWGGRGGISLGWFPSTFTPTLTLEGGAFAEGDATSIASNFAKLGVLGSGVAKQFNYGFGSALVGVEVGSPNFTFFARGGASYVGATLHGFQTALQASTGSASIVAQDPTLTAVLPSFEAGVMVFFL
jgi:hypothetical protein